MAWEEYSPDDIPYPRGEVCVKSANLFMGYWNQEDLTYVERSRDMK